MHLTTEYLPALNHGRQELVLLHGWSMNREAWRPLLAPLRPWANVTLVDLPGCCEDDTSQFRGELPALVTALLEQMPPLAVYLGWSLGGQIATLLAKRAPQRVSALITLCSNPRFVELDGWPGMESHAFADFRAAYDEQPARGLRRFDALQSQRAGRPSRPLLKSLSALRDCSDPGAQLAAGLGWLAELDTREALASLDVPQCHLLGQADGLVPVAIAEHLRRLIGGDLARRVEVLGDASHVALLECPRVIAKYVEDFLEDTGLLRSGSDVLSERDKLEVAASFSRAARTYDSVAALQRDVGIALLKRSPETLPSRARILDLGSGTGYFGATLRERYPQADYLGLDLAEGMIDYARTAHPQLGDWLVGDAEQLPLASASVDFIFSSLAIQWSDRPDLLLAELARVLKPGGRSVFSTLGPGTLGELRAAWATVDSHQHVNHFLPAEALLAAASSLPDVKLRLEKRSFVMRYDKVADLLRELKALGAHNMNDGRPTGLTSRRKLLSMFAAYEPYRDKGGLPASYDVLFGTLEKR